MSPPFVTSQQCHSQSAPRQRERGSRAFKDNQDETDVTQVNESRLPVVRQDVPDGHAVDEADDDLAYQAGFDELGGDPFCHGEEEEE